MDASFASLQLSRVCDLVSAHLQLSLRQSPVILTGAVEYDQLM